MSAGFGKIPVIGQLLRPKAQFVAESPPPALERKTLSPTPKSTPPAAEITTPRQQISPSPTPMATTTRQFSDYTSKESVSVSGADVYQPPINVESMAFLLPEDQVTVELLQRLPENEIRDYVYKPSPLYISSCYDAYSRNYTTISIGKGLAPTIALAKFGNEGTLAPNTGHLSSADMAESGFSPGAEGLIKETSEERFLTTSDIDMKVLQPYCPSLSDWYSTFRSVPDENAHLLSGRVSSDSNVLFKFSKLQTKQKPFEPLFGSVTVYTIIDDEIHRITESFHFDATQGVLRQYYGTCYVDSEGAELHPSAVKNFNFTGTCINVADASGDRTHMHMCNVQIPEEFRYRDLFLVVQLSKIMSCDNEKATAPYYPRAVAPELAKHKESCERLSKYRQPVGLGIVRVNDESGRLLASSSNMGELTVPIYAQKVCLSDQQIQQTIREIYPTDSSNSYVRMETLDIEMKINTHYLGRDDQMIEKLMHHEKGYARLAQAAEAAQGSTKEGFSTYTASTHNYAPIILPAQVQSEYGQLTYTHYHGSLAKYSKAHAALSVRQLLPLLPVNLPRSNLDFTSVCRQAKSSVDNTIFVYPLLLDRFKNRNLSVKVQLVEFRHDIAWSSYPTLLNAPHEVLTSVYNTSYITGPLFMSEAYSRVSYHQKNPAVNDEFKIRLPDVLTARHWVKFTVMHVHVKPTAQRSSLLGKMMSSSVEVADRTSLEVGVGFLPLMLNGESIIEDAEHQVLVYNPEEGPGSASDRGLSTNGLAAFSEGLIRVRTKAVVSLVSGDKRVQAALKYQPVPLGMYPTSIMNGETAARIMDAARAVPLEQDKLVVVTRELARASAIGVSRHFYVLMSQLLRTMLSGTGTVSELYSNPYKHDEARCMAFLTMLQIIGKVANDATGAPSSTSSLSPEKLFLSAYVDYIMDEEMPLELEDQVRAGIMSEERADEIAEALMETTTTAAVNAAAAAVTATTPMKPSTGSLRRTTSSPTQGITDANSAINAAPSTVTGSGEKADAPASALRDRMRKLGVDVTFGGALVGGTITTPVDHSEGSRLDQTNLLDNIELDFGDVDLRPSEDFPGMSAEDLHVYDAEELVATRSRLSSEQDVLGSTHSEAESRPSQDHLNQSDHYPGMSGHDIDGDTNVEDDTNSTYSSDTDNLTAITANNGESQVIAPSKHSTNPASPSADIDAELAGYNSPLTVNRDSECPDCAPDKDRKHDSVTFADEDDEVAPRVEFTTMYDMEQEAAAARAGKFDPSPELTTELSRRASDLTESNSASASVSQSNRASSSLAPIHISIKTTSTPISQGDSPALATHGSSVRSSTRETNPVVVQYGVERQSWGKFITDSMWSSAKLDAIGIAGLNQASSSELSTSISSKYLDDIANHIAMQAEKLIFEELLGLAVHTIGAEVLVSESTPRPSTQTSKSEDLLPTENQILAGKRYRLSKRVSTRTPFEEERTWFAAVDEGRLVDDNDVSIRQRQATESNATAMAMQHQKQLEVQLEKEVCIEPILPVFDPIEGYKARAKKIRTADSASPTAQYQHWWPWLYEVLVFQWGAILTISLSSIKLISGSNTQSMVNAYPYERDIKEQSASKGSLKADSVRSLLDEHCPILLKMILKSLALRIAREGLRPPVVLDVQFMGALENLVMLLAVEAASFSSGLWRSRKMVSSLAGFLRSLFALASPSQVIRLVRSYFRASRRHSRVEESELRLQMVEELGWFDFLVAVNFPYTLDAPLNSFSFECLTGVPAQPAMCSYSTSAYTAVGIRGITNPTPYNLAHILIAEILVSYRQDERKVKDAALEVMRDLLVRHAYDARYQSKIAQQRIACMYLPLLQGLLKEYERVSALKHDSTERKDVLAIFLYMFQGMPDRVLRQFVRSLCHNADEDKNVSFRSGPSPRVLSLKTDKSLTNPSTKAYMPPKLQHTLEVFNLLLILHLILDTFECPRVLPEKPTLTSSVSLGGQAAVATSSVGASAYSQVLAPGVQVEGSTDSLSNLSSALNMRRANTDPAAAQPSSVTKAGVATSLYKNLDQRLQNRKTASLASKRTSGGGTGKGDERSWVDHARKMATVDQGETRNDKFVVKSPISRQTQAEAAQQLCESASRTVISALLVLFEVCPPELTANASADPGGVAHDYAFILRDSNIDPALLVGINNLQVIYFMRKALSVILHGMYCHQTDDLLNMLFYAATTAIRNFGAKVFLVAVEDSLQDWMRISLCHCSSSNVLLANTASNFILYLLRACFHYLGSATLVSNTILAVFNDVLETILDNNAHLIKTYSDEDDVLQSLADSIDKMRAAAKSSILTYIYPTVSSVNDFDAPDSGVPMPNLGSATTSAFCKAVVTLMDNLEIVMHANADLRRHASHPVGFDFYGSNMLDGPWDERNSALMSMIRNKRRIVQPDPVKQAPLSGFHLEEVMMRLSMAAEVYDPFKLPRLRMFWLENLAMLHKRNANRAEGAEVRWRIFKVCELVEDTWRTQWVARPPLPWSPRTSARNTDSVSVHNQTPGTTIKSTGHMSIGRGHDSPLIEQLDPDRDRNFYKVLKAALDAKPNRSWTDYGQYLTHMQTSLDEATKGYNVVNLIHLAERTSFRLVHLYRLLKKPERMLQEYTKMADAVKAVAEKGVTTHMAIGTFYRVLYEGLGVPVHLRGKEFIFRNGNHVHVKEFQDQVLSHLKSIVQDGVNVMIVQNITADHALSDPLKAYIIMNSVKLQINRAAELSVRNMNNVTATNKRPSSFPLSERMTVEATNQVRVFHYSVPFTLTGKSHAKSIDEQWMRSTILTVKEPFPYIMTRQLVQSREIRTYSPIEVAIYDIEERIEAMESELEKVVRNPSDCNNLMRIVQGTVLPQVNAGVGEVAKVFLNPNRGGQSFSTPAGSIKETAAQSALCPSPLAPAGVLAATGNNGLSGAGAGTGGSGARTSPFSGELVESSSTGSLSSSVAEQTQHQQDLVLRLKMTLIDFLSCSKLLLQKARVALIDGQRLSSSDNPTLNTSGSSANLTAGNTAARTSLAGGAQNGATSTNRASLGGLSTSAQSTSSVNSTNSETENTREQLQFITWQTEMEKGFDVLVQSILPYMGDLNDSDLLAALRN